MLKMVEYKDIIDFPGYKIGNNGTLLSNKRSKGFIKVFSNPEGYYFAYLYKNNKRHTLAVHRLVAKYFVPNPNNYDCVNHKDENKSNNNYTNLEWCTHSYNRKYGTCEDRRFNTLSSKFAVKQYDLNHNYIATWRSASEATRALGHANPSGIHGVLWGKRKTAFGFIWEK